jgi:hypothetical protein
MDYGIVRLGSRGGHYEEVTSCTVVEVYGCFEGTYCFIFKVKDEAKHETMEKTA